MSLWSPVRNVVDESTRTNKDVRTKINNLKRKKMSGLSLWSPVMHVVDESTSTNKDVRTELMVARVMHVVDESTSTEQGCQNCMSLWSPVRHVVDESTSTNKDVRTKINNLKRKKMSELSLWSPVPLDSFGA